MTKHLRKLLAGVMLAGLTAGAQAQTTITFRFNDPEAPQMRQALDELTQRSADSGARLVPRGDEVEIELRT